MNFSRRQALLSGAAVPLGLAALGAASPAAAQSAAPTNAIHNTVNVGNFELTTLLAGSRAAMEPQSIFGQNVSAEEFAEVSAENFIPADSTQFFFLPSVVRTGSEVVLFDTGLGAEPTLAALNAAGIQAEDVDVVAITHMHPDHIGGMLNNGEPTYANARYVTGQAEYDFWANSGADGFETNVRPFADKMTFIGDGGTVAPGITGILAAGHTAGHMVFMLDSDDSQLLITGDLANHHVWSLAKPDWEVRFDSDKAQAAQARRNILGMVAADRIPMLGYHLPFPGIGFVETDGDGFRYVPATYQLSL